MQTGNKSHLRSKTTIGSRLGQEGGVAIPISILALLMITLLGVVLTTSGIISVGVTTNEQEAGEALFLAESGIAHAISFISEEGQEFDEYLNAGDGTSCTGDELSDPPIAASFLTAGDEITSVAAGGHTFAGGRYEVVICDDPADPSPGDDNDENDTVVLTATGYGANGARATIEVILVNKPLPALVSEGNTSINGNVVVTGSNGGIHANGDLGISGSPCLEQYVSADGTITGSPNTGTGCTLSPPVGTDVPADTRPSSGELELPDLTPGDFASVADYTLHDDGSVTDSLGTVLKSPSGGGTWAGWNWNAGQWRWRLSGNPISDGTFYSEANIEISGNPGTPGTPINITLIAEGWIDIGGNPSFDPYLTQGGNTYMAIAGTDLKVAGNISTPYEGAFYAGHQIDFVGNASIVGQVIAKNEADTPYPDPSGSNLVTLSGGAMVISGNPNITFDGTGSMKNFVADAWRECRGANPADPCQ